MKYFKLFEEFLSEKDKPENEEDKSEEDAGADDSELDDIDAEIEKAGKETEEKPEQQDKPEDTEDKPEDKPEDEKKVSAIVKQYGIQEVVDNPDKFEGDYFEWPNIQNVFARMNKSIKPLSDSDIKRDSNISTVEKAFNKLYSESGPLENMIVVPLKGDLTNKADELKNKLRKSITKLEFISSDVTDYSRYQFWNGTEFVTLDAATTNVKFYKYTDKQANTFIIRYTPKGENIGMESATAYYGPSDLFDEK
jgi:hypothetical protein